ncbi:MAG: hypothetical protein ACLR9W_00730 [Enterobacter hormaechei]
MSNTSVMLTKEQKAIIAEALDVMPEDLEEIKVKASACKKTSFRDDFSMVFKDNTACSPEWIDTNGIQIVIISYH